MEKRDAQRAKELLADNIHHQELTPQSVEWRDSLFELGKILYREASLAETQSRLNEAHSNADPPGRKELAAVEANFRACREAERMLSEAVERYPDVSQALEARYLIAQAHRQLAELLAKQLSLTTIGPQRTALRKQQQQQLQQAADAYQQLQVHLTRKQDRAPLTALEAAILRNCYYGQGDALLGLARYDEAIRVYSAATSRYQQRPESIEAFVQIADCYRRLDRTEEARGTIEQAKVVLGRLPPDTDFHKTTRYTRKEWSQMLDWMGTL